MLLPTLISTLLLVLAPQHLAAAGEPARSGFHERDLAVVRLASPQQFALLLHEGEEAPRLYKVGDLLGHPGRTAHLLEVERIESDRLVLHEQGTGHRWSLQSNQAAPVVEGLVFLGTVSLTEIQYRFQISSQITKEAPVVLSLADSRAVLMQEVSTMHAERRSARQDDAPLAGSERGGDRATAAALSPQRIDENTYEIDKRALAPTLNKLRKKLAKGLRGITQALLSRGPLLPVQTSVGDGVLSKSGFTVTQPKVAQTFGIEVGDTIVSLNGKPVSSPLNAWWTFQQVFIRDQTRTLRVDLVRAGKPVTKTYRIK